MTLPPLILIINLVYFTRSHDVINNGWLGSVLPSPAFYLMNHDDIRTQLGERVRRAYDDHFSLRRLLYPFTAQEYMGNLMFLRARAGVTSSAALPSTNPRKWRFSNVLPRYDEVRGVWAEYEAADESVPSRWEVSRVDESLNLKGLASIIRVLREQPAPALLLILPTNRAFYRYHGLDMTEYERRYRAIRDAIRALDDAENIEVLDLYEKPPLHLGFLDRMHPDEYGYFQLVQFLINSKPYHRFIAQVRMYYDRLPPVADSNERGTRRP
jgi:hypothetical protein